MAVRMSVEQPLWHALLAYRLLTGAYAVALYVHAYNFQRPHQALDGLVPADRFFRAAPQVRAAVERNVADNAMQVLGGWGYCDEFKVERFLRDAKLLEIGGGTLESHQKNITRDLVEG